MMRIALPMALVAAAAASQASAGQTITTTHADIAGNLVGTLEGELSPGGPAVLIIPGSGPTDRDGNNPLGVAASTYRLIAEALEERGIASVRIDKRGMFGSASATPNANDVTVNDYVADIEAWTGSLIDADAGGCIWLLGHSEGGLMALAAAARDPSSYCGLILVATPGRNVGDVISAQIAANPSAAPLMPQVEALLARLKAGEAVPAEDIHPGLLPLFGPQIQKFMGSLLQQEPAELLASHDLPSLVLNGRRDLQTPDSDAEMLASARDDVRLVLLEDVNHVLKQVAGDDRAQNLASYANADLPLAPGVADTIADFIRQNGRAEQPQ